MLEKAHKVRLFNGMKNKYYLYEIINKTPGLTIYDLTKKLNWSAGKIEYYIQKLLKDNVINNMTEIVNGRVKKSYSAVNYREFMDKKELDFLKNKSILPVNDNPR